MRLTKRLLGTCSTAVLTLAASLGALANAPKAQTPAATVQKPPGQPGKSDFFVMIDAGHGGDDKGVLLAGRIAEKDVTLGLARVLRKELAARGLPAKLVRDNDTNVSLDRRAGQANEQHAGLYIALHAAETGNEERIYTPLLPFASQPTSGRLVAWSRAQAAFLSRSDSLARVIGGELKKKDFRVLIFPAPLRPLDNIMAPAVAVEVGQDPDEPRKIIDPKYQEQLASTLAAAVLQIHPATESQP